VVQHLLQGNETFGLETDIDDDVLVGDLDDGAGDGYPQLSSRANSQSSVLSE
jgi:hypothetical protein